MKEMVCISCPIGCRLKAYFEGDPPSEDTFRVEGNRCSRGRDYAYQEMTAPSRMVTTTVRTRSPEVPRLPVKTLGPFPKEQIPALLALLNGIDLDHSLKRGDVLLKNPLDQEIDVVTTRSFEI